MTARMLAPALQPTLAGSSSAAIIHRKCACGVNASTSSGKCEACEQEALRGVRRKADASPPLNAFAPHAGAQVQATLASPGRKLDVPTRRRFEGALGHDLAHVRIHTDAGAAQSARSVNALAYTAGSHVVFGHGNYAPDSKAGARLLAHELTHTLQWSAMPYTAAMQIDAPDSAEEHQADAVADAFSMGQTVRPIGGVRSHGAAALHRQPASLEDCGEFSTEPLKPKQWLKCVRDRKIDPGRSDPLRFTDTGEIATPQALVSWAIRKGYDEPTMLKHLLSSHEVTGTQRALTNAQWALAEALGSKSLATIRRERDAAREQKQREAEEAEREAQLKLVVEDYYTRGERLKPYDARLLTLEEAAKAEKRGRASKPVYSEGRGVSYRHGQQVGRFTVVDPERAILKVNNWYYYAVDSQTMYDVIHGIVAYAEQVWENTKGINVAYGYIVKTVGEIANLSNNELAQVMGPMMVTAGEGILYDVRKAEARKAGDEFNEQAPEIGWQTVVEGLSNVAGNKAGQRVGKWVSKVSKPGGKIAGVVAGIETSTLINKGYQAAQGNMAWADIFKPDISPMEMLVAVAEGHLLHKFSERWTTGKAPKVPTEERTPPAKREGAPEPRIKTEERTPPVKREGAPEPRVKPTTAAKTATDPAAKGGKPTLGKGQLPSFKPVPEGVSKTLDTARARWSKHDVELTETGLELCSPRPCSLLKKLYKRELDDHPDLASLLDDLEERRLANPKDDRLRRQSQWMEATLGQHKARNALLDAIPDEDVRNHARAVVEVGVGLDRGQLEGFAQQMAKLRSKPGRQRLVQKMEELALRSNVDRNTDQMTSRVERKSDKELERQIAKGEVTSKKAGKTGGSTASRADPTQQDIGLNIDELEAVGAQGTLAERRRRALSLNNREFKDPLTNQRTKHVKIDQRDLDAMKKIRKPVSLAMEQTVGGKVQAKTGNEHLGLWSRRFSEITEVKAVGERILNDMEGTTTRMPGDLKAELNRRLWDEFKHPTSSEGQIVADAIERSGFGIIDTPDGNTGLRALSEGELRARGLRFVKGQGWIRGSASP